MLNCECVDLKNNIVQIVFTDSEADDSIKICLTKKTAADLAKAIMKKCSYAATKKPK